jgi:hypothetical protein
MRVSGFDNFFEEVHNRSDTSVWENSSIAYALPNGHSLANTEVCGNVSGDLGPDQ